MSSMPVRLNKALADAGLCARRKADDLIFSGRVTVNGTLVTSPGEKVDPLKDVIAVDGKNLEAQSQAACCLLLHKPVQVVSTVKDPEGRPCVLEYVPKEHAHRRLYPVGRLDFFSEGLLLLTDDGPLANLLTHPRHHVPRYYEVLVRGWVDEQKLAIMRRGMHLAEGETLAPVDVFARQQGDDTVLCMTLFQGVNRQIRRMCRDLKLVVLRLVRVGLGPLELGDLPVGAARELSKAEVASLREAAHKAAEKAAQKAENRAAAAAAQREARAQAPKERKGPRPVVKKPG